jgi:hypothetical protein
MSRPMLPSQLKESGLAAIPPIGPSGAPQAVSCPVVAPQARWIIGKLACLIGSK